MPTTEPTRSKSFKKRIEKDSTLAVLSIIVTSFLAGIGFVEGLERLTGRTLVSVERLAALERIEKDAINHRTDPPKPPEGGSVATRNAPNVPAPTTPNASVSKPDQSVKNSTIIDLTPVSPPTKKYLPDGMIGEWRGEMVQTYVGVGPWTMHAKVIPGIPSDIVVTAEYSGIIRCEGKFILMSVKDSIATMRHKITKGTCLSNWIVLFSLKSPQEMELRWYLSERGIDGPSAASGLLYRSN
jgi:hypothetical protein